MRFRIFEPRFRRLAAAAFGCLLLSTTAFFGVRRLTDVFASVALAILAIAFASTALGVREAEERAGRPPYVLAFLIGAAALQFEMRRNSGVPAFAHDWKWPLVGQELASWPQILGSLWLDWGSGGAAVQALANYPIVLLGSVFGSFATPAIALRLVLAVIGGVAGLGAAALAARFSLGTGLALIAAALYPLMPVSFNRLNAGHLLWLLAYAVVPWLIATFEDDRNPRKRIALSGLLFGLVALQTQFIFFVGGILALFCRRKVLAFAAVILTGCLLCAPVLAAIAASHLDASFASAHPTSAWQTAQSAPTLLALVSGADPIRYFERGSPPWLLFFPSIALACLGATLSRRGALLGISWIAGAAWSAGTRGPFGWFLAQLPMSTSGIAFREYSHAEVIVGPALLVLALVGARAISRTNLQAAVVACAVLLPLALPALTGVANLGVSRNQRALEQTAGVVAAMPDDGEVLWWPGMQPLVYAGSRGGVDSDAFIAGRHPPYTDYRPTPQIVVAMKALQDGDPAACSLLANLGVQAVVVRDGVRMAIDLGLVKTPPKAAALRSAGLREIASTASARIYAVPCYRGRVTVSSAARELYGDWHDFLSLQRRDLRDVVTSAPDAGTCRTSPPAFDYTTLDDSRGLVPLAVLDSKFARFGWAFDNVAVTSNLATPFSGNYVLAAQANDKYRWYPTRNLRTALRQEIGIWKVASCKQSPPQSIDRFPALLDTKTVAHGLLREGLSLSGGILAGGGLVVFHQTSYGAWQARTGEGFVLQPAPVNGYAIGWRIPRGTKTIRIYYAAPQVQLFWLLAALTAAFDIVLLILALTVKRQA